MITLARITAFLVLLFTAASCNFDAFSGIKGNGNVVSEERNITSTFESIKVQQGITLYLTQDNDTRVKVEADDNIIDLLITEVKNNELRVYFEKNVYKAESRKVYLTTSTINKIATSSGSTVLSDNTIQTNKLELDSSSGSSIKIDVVATEIYSESSSGSTIKISGKANLIHSNASSGSSTRAEKLETNEAVAKVSSGASINVNTTNSLQAKASSGGSVNYEGNPKTISKETSSGGSVSQY